ncbi:MAG: hypothetical protein LC808_37825 [Actinobacteria bacterium]|nr:hypothetical protein [Actinomycetota bacterium]
MPSWEELELPVLRWVQEAGDGGTGQLAHGSPTPFEGVPAVSEAGVEEALTRLEEFGLIVGRRVESSDYSEWSQLRPTANGLRVLGEWPPADGATLQEALVNVLLSLAEDLPEAEATPVRRTAGGLARFGGHVLSDITQRELRRVGEDTVS